MEFLSGRPVFRAPHFPSSWSHNGLTPKPQQLIHHAAHKTDAHLTPSLASLSLSLSFSLYPFPARSLISRSVSTYACNDASLRDEHAALFIITAGCDSHTAS